MNRFLGQGACIFLCALVAATTARAVDPAPPDAAALIFAAASQSDFAFERLARLCDTFGPRQVGSSNLEAAIDWTLAQMKADGLENVRGEEVTVGHWVRGAEAAELIEPRHAPIAVLGVGGTVATSVEGITAEVLVVTNFADLKARGAEAAGKIVLFNQPFTTYTDTVPIRKRGAVEAARLGAVASLIRSVTPESLHTLHTGNLAYSNDVPKIPHAALTIEDADMLARFQARGEKIVMRLRLADEMLPDVTSRNVIAEVTGSEKPEEIVIVSGHFDSWDVGQGAQDDGGGAVAAWETIRLIHQLGLHPRRTIRTVLWTSEETTQAGAKNYVLRHKDELARHSLAIEADEGTFPPTEFSFTGGNNALEILKPLTAPMSSLGDISVVMGGDEADVAQLRHAGVPTMALHVRAPHYFWFHHTKADTVDKVDPRDMRSCVAAMAVMTWQAANTPDPLPRSP